MGTSRSKEAQKENVKEYLKDPENDEKKRIEILAQLEKQFEELKSEVTSLEPSIKENVKTTINQAQDALLLRYSQLKDKEMVTNHIKEVLGNFPFLEFLVDAATTLVSVMNSSEGMKEILRWHERKMVKRVGDKVIGMEAYYKVKILEETKGSMPGFKSKDTVVLIAYKFIAHNMDLPPEDFPDEEMYKKITF